MLFMKGSALEPRCKFSRAIVDILNGLNADYKTYDILSNEEVRQGLKEYSKWPTYPQVHISASKFLFILGYWSNYYNLPSLLYNCDDVA